MKYATLLSDGFLVVQNFSLFVKELLKPCKPFRSGQELIPEIENRSLVHWRRLKQLSEVQQLKSDLLPNFSRLLVTGSIFLEKLERLDVCLVFEFDLKALNLISY